MATKVIAIMGSYRKNGFIDQATDAILAAARKKGAEVQKINLIDKHIEFCLNCRRCALTEGKQRGKCVQTDDYEEIMSAVDQADALVLAAPVNFFNINALTRRFLERMVTTAYWPWTRGAPKEREKSWSRRAILVTSTAMPGIMIPLFTGAPRALKAMAATMNAKVVGSLYFGLCNSNAPSLSPRVLRKAARLGQKLARA